MPNRAKVISNMHDPANRATQIIIGLAGELSDHTLKILILEFQLLEQRGPCYGIMILEHKTGGPIAARPITAWPSANHVQVKTRVFDVRGDAWASGRGTGKRPLEAEGLEGLQQTGVGVEEEAATIAWTFNGFLEDGEQLTNRSF